ncbi:type II secretion system protein [bacterium]|nr:type II secretion system protein [bacterium]
MIKIKKDAFTLSEVLITLAVIGTLAALVIPGLIKDTSNRAATSLIQSTVSTLNSAVQNELVQRSTTNVRNTDIMSAPAEFLKRNFDVAKVCSTETPNECYANTSTDYKNLKGGTVGLWYTKQAVLLKNGVTIDISPSNAGSFNNKFLPISIDLNGPEPPNIAGIDRHIVCVALDTDIEAGIHSGDVGACLRNGYTRNDTRAKLLNACKSGNTEICYYLMEISGFDPNYMNN